MKDNFLTFAIGSSQDVITAVGTNSLITGTTFRDLASGAFKSSGGEVLIENCVFQNITQSAVELETLTGKIHNKAEAFNTPSILRNCSFVDCVCKKGGALHLHEKVFAALDSCHFS
jgi:hypothetical protein